MKQFSFEGISDYVDVISILDGDTICISVPINMQFGESKKNISDTFRFNIRLYGIDTSELKSKDPLAHKAKTRLTQLIEESGNRIFVKLLKYDKYGRILCELYKNNDTEISFNNILLNEGLAKSYFGGTK